MTAEIVIMNKEAVALAADSAITMTRKREQKIFPTTNKLFALSKYCPIGIMIYGNSNFMEVPWETIIKIYRTKLKKQKFNTLREYTENFIAFLNNDSLFPESRQKNYLYRTTRSYFALIKRIIEEKIKLVVTKKGKVTNDQIKETIVDVIKNHFDKVKKTKMLSSIPENHAETIIKKYGNIIDRVKEEIFEKLPIPSDLVNQLKNIGASLFSKDIFQVNISGVVIAGFGEKDTFPSLKSFEFEGIVNKGLKYKEISSAEISFDNSASISPFAQQEMVHTFMKGIDPYLQSYIGGYLSEIFTKYPEIIVENIEKFSNNEKEAFKEKLKKESDKILKDWQDRIKTYIRTNYIDPVVEVVTMLPKDELAVMSETLVNLTLFKQKVTMESETVGGHIDVAVISKGDGFVWIKRKHYFKPELNPQFFDNYYRR